MSKKIVSSMLILVFALNIFVAAVNATCDQQYPPPTDDIFPIDGAYLYLYDAGDNVKVEGTITYNYPPLPPPPCDSEQSSEVYTAVASLDSEVVPAWDIRVTGDFGSAILGLPWSGVQPTEMWQIDIVPGDVNYDGTVNCEDIKIIIMAYGSSLNSRSLRSRYNPDCDLNGDNRINLRDLCIALKNFGETADWMPLPNVVVIGNMIYGEPDHFSIFRCR